MSNRLQAGPLFLALECWVKVSEVQSTTCHPRSIKIALGQEILGDKGMGRLRSESCIERKSFRKKLLAWYKAHRRDLPWAAAPDPFPMLLSKIILPPTPAASAVRDFPA